MRRLGQPHVFCVWERVVYLRYVFDVISSVYWHCVEQQKVDFFSLKGIYWLVSLQSKSRTGFQYADFAPFDVHSVIGILWPLSTPSHWSGHRKGLECFCWGLRIFRILSFASIFRTIYFIAFKKTIHPSLKLLKS